MASISKPVTTDSDGHAERRRIVALIERLQVDQSLPSIVRETASKWSGLLARLSLIFHLVELAERRQPVVDRHQMPGSCVVMAGNFLRRILLPNLFRLGHETMPEEGAAHARWIAGHILAHRLERITARDIGRTHRTLRGKPHEVAEVMAILIDASWVVKDENSRHDGQAWIVNPAVHLHFAKAAEAEKERRDAVKALIRNKQLAELLH